jgi:hypothetical protein
MAFMDKYALVSVPAARRTTRVQQTPEEHVRQRMMTALDIQSALLQAEMAEQPYTITRNGKPQQPRPFWMQTPTGLLFTPRFGNEFLFAKGQGVMAKDRSALAELLNDFGSAITAGEFDARLMEISRNRGPGRQGGGGRRGRRQAQP